MNTLPSFASLYRQSRYAKTEAHLQGSRQDRRELFAVASVAFVMEHEVGFKRVFLQQICNAEQISDTELASGFTFELQPASHADLRIRCPGRRALYIVEFKIGARLMTKQDFSPKGKFLKRPDGYGWKILHEKAYRDCDTKTYVVLQNERGFKDSVIKGIQVRSKTWKDLIVEPEKESRLVADLLDMLGNWNIASLRFRKTKHMKKALQTSHAADIFQIVTSTATDTLGIRRHNLDLNAFDVQPDDGAESYFGINIPFGLKTYSKLSSAVGRNDDGLGWFGYVSRKGSDPTLAIWLYCKPSTGSRTSLMRTKQFVDTRLQSKMASVKSDDRFLKITESKNSALDDHQWFTTVFEALQDEPS